MEDRLQVTDRQRVVLLLAGWTEDWIEAVETAAYYRHKAMVKENNLLDIKAGLHYCEAIAYYREYGHISEQQARHARQLLVDDLTE